MVPMPESVLRYACYAFSKQVYFMKTGFEPEGVYNEVSVEGTLEKQC